MAGLSQEAVRQYQREGFVSPVRVMSAAEAGGYRRKLEEIEASLLERGKLPRRATRRASRTPEPL